MRQQNYIGREGVRKDTRSGGSLALGHLCVSFLGVTCIRKTALCHGELSNPHHIEVRDQHCLFEAGLLYPGYT